jgi:hypothetical protein
MYPALNAPPAERVDTSASIQDRSSQDGPLLPTYCAALPQG